LHNLQAAYRLNGKNYLKWSQLIWTFLKGKGKLNHLLGTSLKEGDPAFAAWHEEDFPGDVLALELHDSKNQ